MTNMDRGTPSSQYYTYIINEEYGLTLAANSFGETFLNSGQFQTGVSQSWHPDPNIYHPYYVLCLLVDTPSPHFEYLYYAYGYGFPVMVDKFEPQSFGSYWHLIRYPDQRTSDTYMILPLANDRYCLGAVKTGAHPRPEYISSAYASENLWRIYM